MLGIGLHTTTLARRARTAEASPPAFTPMDLPLAAWFDPSDTSTLFQDAAGTVPVSADGDPVALMLDKSGNGHHMSQPDVARRPIYHVENGQHWIAADGIDDSMYTLSRMGFDANPDITILAGTFVPSTSLPTERLLHIGAPSEIGTLSASMGQSGFSWRHNNGNSIYDSIPLNSLMMVRWSRVAGTDYGASTCALNGVDMVQKGSASATQIPTSIAQETYLFAHGNTHNILNARLYGLIIGAFSDVANQNAAEGWMANKLGVSLG